MKINFNATLFIVLAASILGLNSCSKESKVSPEKPISASSGVYILNQGTLKGDNASLSFFDFHNKSMSEKVFLAANPSKKLGSGGNDMAIYGSKLYVSVFESNKLEIADSGNGKSLKTIEITEPRFIAFHGNHAFVSAYTNQVFVIDTATLNIVKTIDVGRTPEQLAVSGDRVFVANSGWRDGFQGEEYDNTVSVIDAISLTKIQDLEVRGNMEQVYTDDKGLVYAIDAPIFGVWPLVIKPSHLSIIDAATLETVKVLEFSGIAMAIKDNRGFLISDNYREGGFEFLEMDLTTFQVTVRENFLNEIQNPYSLAVDPNSGDIWIGDAMDFGDNGQVLRFIKGNGQPEIYPVGISPKKFVFKH